MNNSDVNAVGPLQKVLLLPLLRRAGRSLKWREEYVVESGRFEFCCAMTTVARKYAAMQASSLPGRRKKA